MVRRDCRIFMLLHNTSSQRMPSHFLGCGIPVRSAVGSAMEADDETSGDLSVNRESTENEGTAMQNRRRLGDIPPSVTKIDSKAKPRKLFISFVSFWLV